MESLFKIPGLDKALKILKGGLYFLRIFFKYPVYAGCFLRHKYRLWQRYRWIRKNDKLFNAVPPVLVYKLVLTNRCDLRCSICMLWGKAGPYLSADKTRQPMDEMDWDLITKLFLDEGSRRPAFILSGGEPLMYSRFIALSDLLKKYKCPATICTNGMLLKKYKETFLSNPYLTALVSLDGLEQTNDSLRGKGVYRVVTGAIQELKNSSRPPYIGVQFTMQKENIREMYSFCKTMVSLGVDWVLMNPQWFLSVRQAQAYEKFMDKEFHIFPTSHKGYQLPYEIDVNCFREQQALIAREKWPIQISYYFNNPCSDIVSYMNDDNFISGNTLCYKQWIRMDIMPDGKVVACQQYPDLVTGDFLKEGSANIWNGPTMQKLRTLISKSPLPVCNKCAPLYLYDMNRFML